MLSSRGHELFGWIDILWSMPWCLGSDDAASEAASAALDLTVAPLACAAFSMTVTLLVALSCDGPDPGTSL